VALYQSDIVKIKKQFDSEIEETRTSGQFDELYLKYFSKTSGIITGLMKEIPTLSEDEKREFGPKINALQNELKDIIEQEKSAYEKKQLADPLIDLSYFLPPKSTGMLHPTTITIREMHDFFRYHGFSVYEGPEIDNEENMFRKLNLPEGHPATDLQDSLFINEPKVLLRTHTSSVEARALTDIEPPMRIVVAGKCYRNETPSPSNASFFHQYQGFVVDKGINIQNLKAIMEDMIKFLFGNDTVVRFRYKYYPEVSPGLGTDIQCKFCKGKGCAFCKFRGWVEMGGSGMIHYNTLKMCGIDPEEYTGFAFGMGLDRLALSKFSIPDIRKLYGGIVYK